MPKLFLVGKCSRATHVPAPLPSPVLCSASSTTATATRWARTSSLTSPRCPATASCRAGRRYEHTAGCGCGFACWMPQCGMCRSKLSLLSLCPCPSLLPLSPDVLRCYPPTLAHQPCCRRTTGQASVWRLTSASAEQPTLRCGRQLSLGSPLGTALGARADRVSALHTAALLHAAAAFAAHSCQSSVCLAKPRQSEQSSGGQSCCLATAWLNADHPNLSSLLRPCRLAH